MTPERWQQVERVYHAALERADADARCAYLDAACGDDTGLRREVESLLRYAAAAGTFIDVPAVALAATLIGEGTDASGGIARHRPHLQRGTALGRYEILEPLGAGGMGEVYRARDTRLGRIVAIKTLPRAVADDPERRERLRREARAISSLAHAHICTLHDIAEDQGVDFLVMEFLAGETLSERLRRGALPVAEVARIGMEIADALGAAHAQGIVHRDIKPSNVLLMTNGHVKVLDFGLAKLVASLGSELAAMEPAGRPTGDMAAPGPASRAAQRRAATLDEEQGAFHRHTLTITGDRIGSAAYMSPEQIRGEPLDGRTDLFSCGLVLYEMTTGRQAFSGETSRGVAAAILDETPPPPSRQAARVPALLDTIIAKALAKDRNLRYQQAAALRADLQRLLAPRVSRRSAIAALVVAGAVVALGGWSLYRSSRERRALATATPEISRLLDEGEFAKAASLAREARAVLPEDPTLRRLWGAATAEAKINSEPRGAIVSIRPLRSETAGWEVVGRTPLNNIRVPRLVYAWQVAKPGFVPMRFLDGFSGTRRPGMQEEVNRTFTLRRENSVPTDMVAVTGDSVSLGYPYARVPSVEVADYAIDRHEITNEQYKTFVDAGGYTQRDFWKQPFVRNGTPVSWEKAIDTFRDTTGHPGPATWQSGTYPDGKGAHPVAGVSWYEAAAYAEFAGRQLPTVFHWTNASQSQDFPAPVAAGSNFGRAGTQPVGLPGTLSGFGTTDMAGNVKEWCWNEGEDGKRFILGGGFGEPLYMFNFADLQSPWDRGANFGFRTVKLDSPPPAKAVARVAVAGRDYVSDRPVSDEVFAAYKGQFFYDKRPLNGRVDATDATASWKHETLSFDAAYGSERVVAHLFLPRNAAPPFQTVVYFPGGFALLEDRIEIAIIDEGLDFLPKNGRALLFPIYKGTYERRDGLSPDGRPPAFFRDHAVMWSKDLGRSLDYLETRGDIDATRFAYMGFSMGTAHAPVLLAVEPRIKTAILESGGFQDRHDLPEVEALNFAPRVTIPVLMMNGRYDPYFPLATSQRAFFERLGTPAKDKVHLVFEAVHAIPRRAEVSQTLAWLDKYLGPVRR